MKGVREGSPGGVPEGTTSVMTRVVARVLFLPIMVTAAAILVKGYAEPGDGFSAGVVASLGIVMQYLAFGRDNVDRWLPIRGIGYGAFAGLLVTLVVAARPLFLGEPALTHWPPPGAHVIYVGTLELITAVLFDFGIFLLVVGYGTGTINLITRLIEHSSRREKEEEAGRDPDEAFGEGIG